MRLNGGLIFFLLDFWISNDVSSLFILSYLVSRQIPSLFSNLDDEIKFPLLKLNFTNEKTEELMKLSHWLTNFILIPGWGLKLNKGIVKTSVIVCYLSSSYLKHDIFMTVADKMRNFRQLSLIWTSFTPRKPLVFL